MEEYQKSQSERGISSSSIDGGQDAVGVAGGGGADAHRVGGCKELFAHSINILARVHALEVTSTPSTRRKKKKLPDHTLFLMAKRGVNKKSCSGQPPPRNRRANIAAAAATTISELPDDVIFDILVRMPDIKSVIRCKRVCKKWRNLILQPCFAKSQSSRGSLPPSLIFYSPPDATNPTRFGILELDDDLDRLGSQNATITFRSGIYIPHELYKRRLIGACNGLVCLHVDGDIVVCNPILQGRRPLVLPKLPKPAHSGRSRFGFGFRPLSDQYKVLRCNETNRGHIISFEVCTLGRDDTWRSIGGHNGKPFLRRYNASSGIDFVCVNGALCWLGWDMASRCLCYFDVENEELANLSLPRGIYGIVHLGVLDDLLYLSEVQSSIVNVWVMKDYVPTGVWALKWVVKPPYSLGLFGPVQPIKILEDETVVMIFRDKVLVSHNPQTGLSKIIKYLEVVIWTELIAHTPSFFCPPWLQ
ncbi:hypothetical protein RHMOL_Rhmol04G0065800 [Rhododendron molle]|uniref:Uncharacterized protein n=1 Tax=Rhododendron molle TaxID=49168 RepID=A0ACC0NZW8_RHOML|nr:hypothetical protein RHMOL_Rhmol04G0065800 [Rhododendron molle]